MSETDIRLLLTALFGVLFLVGLIVSKIRLHPLLALLLSAVAVGFAAGLVPGDIAKAISAGAGHTLGDAGLVIALGAMLGKILSDTGVTETIANAITARASERALPWAMALAAFIVGIPMFFEVGLVVLLPLIFSVARKLERGGHVKGSPYVLMGVPAIAALAAMHGMVPPHPGPLTAIAALKANVGPTMLLGFIAAIPAIALGGPIYGHFIAPRLTVRPDEALLEQYTHAPKPGVEPPSVGLGLLAVLMPALLMLAHTIADAALPKGAFVTEILSFLGKPVIAMLASVIFACIMLVYLRSGDRDHLRESLGASLKPIAGILLIIGGGGAFQQVLVRAKVGEAIVHLAHYFSLPALPLGWLIAMLLSVSTGSATVGIVGAAGLLAPLAAADPAVNLALLAIAIGSGSLFFNYANHAGFWFVKESFGMTMSEATWTISIIQSIVAIVGLVMVMLLNLVPNLPH
ncbi:gluconate:H+ symporter [Enterovirga sp.]|uniref:GntP family permease n=1 Tax=Enterovirga sp. TaxID=2026350 RepID=UPI002C082F6A|nr:gluconate:H+ symporter [Enterovirga sp.]HMO31160.1 gluconate:H+ symporter [Enterovirga sp.]